VEKIIDMNYRYTQKDIKIIDMSNNEADFMYNWIREKSGKVKPNVTTNDSNTHLDVRGSNKNNNDNEMDTNNTIQSNEYSSKESDTK
jgi:hypothetical protein